MVIKAQSTSSDDQYIAQFHSYYLFVFLIRSVCAGRYVC